MFELISSPYFCLNISIGRTPKIRVVMSRKPGTLDKTTAKKDKNAVGLRIIL